VAIEGDKWLRPVVSRREPVPVAYGRLPRAFSFGPPLASGQKWSQLVRGQANWRAKFIFITSRLHLKSRQLHSRYLVQSRFARSCPRPERSQLAAQRHGEHATRQTAPPNGKRAPPPPTKRHSLLSWAERLASEGFFRSGRRAFPSQGSDRNRTGLESSEQPFRLSLAARDSGRPTNRVVCCSASSSALVV